MANVKIGAAFISLILVKNHWQIYLDYYSFERLFDW